LSSSRRNEGAGEVTKEKYQRYKRQRGPEGKGGQQGVGETQLTHYSFQDEADALGGTWKADPNVKVAFRLLSRLIKKHGEAKGLAAYNAGEGGWRNGQQYAREVQKRQHQWHKRLA
jgi:Transglycosylase SLT domain